MAVNDENLVTAPPLLNPIADKNGNLSRAWSIWFRDLYRRTAYKGGNAIDDNKNEIDNSIIDIDATLQEVIDQVIINIDNIQTNNTAIVVNETAIQQNETDLDVHEALTTAHGSNGNIVGFDDLATEVLYGLVKRMATLGDAIQSTATVVQADATAAPGAYSQTHSQELVDLSNANKAAINSLVTDFNNAVTVLNNLIARSKTSGQMTT